MRIHTLDIETRNRIAAGEVIERPSSVIKELCENALDAGATAITVEIQGGGLETMRVVDNGVGIVSEDLPLAFERHTTGKIQSGDSLMGIETLGFRGEALSSIAAVSMVEAVSRTHDAELGSRLELHGGQVISHMTCGCPEGTAITVRSLFYNTPARLKFTKSASAETARISDIMLRIMLANPDVSFRFLNQQNVVMQTPGTGLIDAIRALYGAQTADGCIPVEACEGLNMHGYIGKPDLSRKTRAAQTLIVNGRYIQNAALSNAVAQGYEDRMMTSRFPFFVLHLDMPFAVVDVNVHPQKLEVRFTDEQQLSQWLKENVQKAWEQYRNRNGVLPPGMREGLQPHTAQQATSTQNAVSIADYTQVENGAQSDDADRSDHPSFAEQRADVMANRGMDMLREPTGIDLPFSVNDKIEPAPEQLKWEAEYASLSMALKPIGQLFETYLLIESDETLYIIDQHAAHERLTFDALSESYQKGEVISQGLLNPVLVEMTYRDVQAFMDMKQTFEALGFEIEPFGETGLIVRAVPVLMDQGSVRGLLSETLDLAQSGSPANSLSLQRERIIRFACRHSIKSGDVLTDEELKALIRRLQENETLTCPHGRPVAIRIDKRELEKGFKRIV